MREILTNLKKEGNEMRNKKNRNGFIYVGAVARSLPPLTTLKNKYNFKIRQSYKNLQFYFGTI